MHVRGHAPGDGDPGIARLHGQVVPGRARDLVHASERGPALALEDPGPGIEREHAVEGAGVLHQRAPAEAGGQEHPSHASRPAITRPPASCD